MHFLAIYISYTLHYVSLTNNSTFIIHPSFIRSSIDGKQFGEEIEEMAKPIPHGWEIKRGWQTGVTDSDPEGWEYSPDMRSNYWYPEGQGNVALCVRRRVWSRVITKSPESIYAPS